MIILVDYAALLEEREDEYWNQKAISMPWLQLKPQHQRYLRELYALTDALKSARPAEWAEDLLKYDPFPMVVKWGPHLTHYRRDGRFEPWQKQHYYQDKMSEAKRALRDHGIRWRIDKKAVILVECWYDDKNIHSLCPWQDICKIRL